MKVNKMSNNKEFNQKARIDKFTLTGRIRESDVPAEGNLFLTLTTEHGSLKLECFIYGNDAYGLYNGEIKVNDLVPVEFALLSDIDRVKKTGKNVKRIMVKTDIEYNPHRGNIDYVVCGEVLKVYSHPRSEMEKDYVRVVLDCGIYIHTTVRKHPSFKVGDYIEVEGRLDAHIIEKMDK